MRKILMCILLCIMVCSCVGCNNAVPANNIQTSMGNFEDEQSKKESEEKARKEAEERAKKEAEEKLKSEARPVVEGFMNEFLVLDLKGMAEHTNANIDYSEMTYLSLDEYKREMLSEFTVFQSMGLPLEGFSSIVDKVFDSFEKYSSYQIINAEVQGENVALM